MCAQWMQQGSCQPTMNASFRLPSIHPRAESSHAHTSFITTAMQPVAVLVSRRGADATHSVSAEAQHQAVRSHAVGAMQACFILVSLWQSLSL
jgi:hypothetical protein